MVFAITPGETREYVLQRERESESPTIWILRNLTRRERAKIEDSIGAMDKNEQFCAKVGSSNLLTLRFGLAGWKNFCFQDGSEAQFKTKPGPFGRGIPTNETLDLIPYSIVSELVEAINSESTVSEEDEKN